MIIDAFGMLSKGHLNLRERMFEFFGTVMAASKVLYFDELTDGGRRERLVRVLRHEGSEARGDVNE